MELSAKNAERMNKLLGITEDDLKKSKKQPTVSTQGTRPQGLNPAYVAASIADEHDRNENKYRQIADRVAADHAGEDVKGARLNQIAQNISQHHDWEEDYKTDDSKRLRAGVFADDLLKAIQDGTDKDLQKDLAYKLRAEATTGSLVNNHFNNTSAFTDEELNTLMRLYNQATNSRFENAISGAGAGIAGNITALAESLWQEASDSKAYIDQYEGDYWKDFFTKSPAQMQADREAAGYGIRPLDEDSFSRKTYGISQDLKSAATAGLSEDGLGDTKYFSPKWMAEHGISLAENAPNLALSAINPVLGSAYMVANAGGGRALELAEQGVGTQAAITRGLISGGIEAATEKFSIDNWMDALTNNKGVLMNILGQMGVEASEESASYVLNYIADKAAKDPNAQFSWNELMDSAIGGAFSGGIYGGIGQIGRKGAEQAQRTLGENSRKNYEKAKEEDAGRTPDFDRQFDHYNKMGELGIEFDQIPEIASATPVSDAVKQGAYLTGKNDGVERATKLADKALQGETLTDAEIDSVLGHKETRQHFESAAGVKFSQSNAKNRTTVREYAEAEQKKPRLVKNDFSKEFGAETEDMFDRLAKRGGAQIEIVESIADGSAGKYLDGKIQISAEKLREDREGTLRAVVMHEMTHHIETSGQYEQLKSGIESYLKSKGVDVDYELEILAEEYEANGVDLLEDDRIWREYIAKNVETLLSDEDSVRYLARENRGLFDKIREFLRDLVMKIKGTQDEKTVRELLKIYDHALDTVDAHPENRLQGEQHTIERTLDGARFVEVDEDILAGVDPSDWVKTVKENLKKKFPNGIVIGNSDIRIDKQSREEMTFSGYTKWLKKNDTQAYADKLRATDHADEILTVTDNWTNEGLEHPRKDKIVSFARGQVLLRIGGRDYAADVVVGTEKNGRMKLYDIVDLQPTVLAKKETDTAKAANPSPGADRSTVSISNNSIPQNGAIDNANFTPNSGQTSVGRSIDELRVQGQQMTPEERKAYVEASRARRAKLRDLADQYGEIPQGERPAREISLPKQTNDDTRVRRFARTAAEASALSDEQAGAIEQAVLDGVFDYEPIGDQSAVERAEAKILRDAEQAKRDWAAVVNSNDRITKNDIALGELLLKQAAEAGDTQEVIRLTAEIAAAGTQAGQVVQAMRLLKQMGGAGQLAGIDQLTNQYQKDLDKRYGKKAPQLDIPDNLKQDLANAKTEAEIERAKDAIFKHIASQIPSTWSDKWNAWRYLAMLGNPRTHIRNVLGNALFEPMVGVKNVLGAAMESAFVKDGKERTKTLKPANRAVKDFAKADYAEMEEIVKHGGKYNDGQKIDDYRTIFTNKAIEWARKANGKALEKEDGIFLGLHYTRALASYITANNLDVAKLGDGSRESAKLLDKARAYAIREAQKATYRDASQTAELIAQTARRGNAPVRMVLEGVLPFKKTPINILKRGLEYSPAGLVKAVYKGVDGLKNGGYTANEFIDDLAAGLSGSALLGLGYMMTSMGLLSGGSDDEDESKWFKDMLGYQSYALRAGDTTYTLDWMAPGSMPLFVGVELFNLKHGDKLDAKDMLQAMELVTAPLNNMSMLSGLNDTLDNLAYGGDTDNALMNLFTDSVLSYLSQAVPTIGGQVARTMDGTRRTTYADPNNAMPDSWEKALQKAGNKIPYLSEKNPAYINLWGETEETENPLYRFMTNALSPGYVDTIEMDELDEELLRLYGATGENVFPDSAGKSIRVDNETKKFTVDEFRTYATALGQTSHEVLYGLTDSKQYRNADDSDKVAGIDMAYQYARALAKTEVSDYEMDGWIAKAHEGASVDLSPEDYILYKLACLRTDADQNGSITQEEAKKAIDSMDGLNKKQKAYLWQSQNKSWKANKNPYK